MSGAPLPPTLASASPQASSPQSSSLPASITPQASSLPASITPLPASAPSQASSLPASAPSQASSLPASAPSQASSLPPIISPQTSSTQKDSQSRVKSQTSQIKATVDVAPSSDNDNKTNNQDNRRPPDESDLQAWLKGYTDTSDTSESGADGAYLSYDWFIILAVLGGWFGLDHLYLRSPWSFLAKLVVNFLFFGIWYFYDIIQAFSSKDVIKVYGVGLPGFPAKRVAMGVLAQDEPSTKHFNFFIYALCLFMGGMFGLDSFLVGDRKYGIIRLLCLISIIFTPIALGWWVYKLFKFFTDTPSVVNQYASYFGSAGGGWNIFGSLMDPRTIIGTIVQPFGLAAQTAATAWKETATAARESVEMGKQIVAAVGTAGEILSKAQVTSPIPDASIIEKLAAELKRTAGESATQSATQSAATNIAQEGGGSLNILPYTLLGTIALIALSGFVATYYRSKKHVAAPQDDRPPEPGVFRKPDSKEYAA